RLLAGGTLSGQSQQTLRELKKLVRAAAGEGKLIHAGGRSFKPDDYAELVFQTKLAETTNVATVQRLQGRGIFYVKVIGSNSRNFCTAFVGRVFYTGPGSDPLGLYPHISELPRGGAPFHPRCTKRYVPFVPRLATPAQLEDAQLRPHERELLGKPTPQAQKTYTSKAPANPDPAPPVDPPRPPMPVAAGDDDTVAVSERVSVPKSGQLRPALLEAVAAIDAVHRVPSAIRQTPVIVVPRANFEGQLKVRNWQVQINSRTDLPASTLAHEYGHVFEREVLGGFGVAAGNPAFEAWKSAILRSDTYGQLHMKALITRSRYDTYLVTPVELFARSYAQWIAQASGNAKMLFELRNMRDRTRPPIQWDYDEFSPIAAAFDSAFERLGLKR
ncbi:MAG TPA: hypothetical protein VF624_18120, partial [Tepidisphaeraceae bacterium]